MHSRIHIPGSAFLLILVLSFTAMAILFQPDSLALAAGIAPKSETGKNTAGLNRTRAEEYFNKGVQYQDQGRYVEAAQEYQKAVDIDEEYAEAFSNLGYAYRKQGEFEKAIRNYKQAIDLQPDLAEAHEYIGEAYAEMGEFEKAEKHLAILNDLGSEEAAELEEFIRHQKKSL